MPVKGKIERDELLEQGWRQMQGILEKEMPQKRSRKLGLWLPFSILAAIIIIAALTMITIDSNNEAAPLEEAQTDKSFVQSTQEAQNKNSADLLDNSLTGSDVSSDSNADQLSVVDEQHAVKSQVEHLAITDATSAASASQVSMADEQQAVSSQVTKQTVSADQKDIASNAPSGIDANESTSAGTGLNVESAVVSDLDSRPVQVPSDLRLQTDSIDFEAPESLAIIPASKTGNINAYGDGTVDPVSLRSLQAVSTLDLPEVQKLSAEFEIQPIVPAVSKIKPRFGLEIFGAPHFASSVELQGIEAGALITMTLGRRWKLSSGLSYGHYNTNGLIKTGGTYDALGAEKFTVPVTQDTNTIASNTVPEIAYGLIDYDTAQLLAEKFNYLHFPISAQYRLGRIMSVIGGFKFSYLLNAPASSNFSVSTLNSNSQMDLFDLVSSRNFLAEENILRKWDIAPVVGIAFDLGRKWAIDLQYQHGLIPYVDRPTENERSDYHRSVSFGLRYTIL